MSRHCRYHYIHCGIALQSAHSHGHFNRDVRPENILVDRETQKIYLVDWGSAASRSDFPLPFEGTVHYSAARILDQLIAISQAVIFTCADDLESLVCSAFACVTLPCKLSYTVSAKQK